GPEASPLSQLFPAVQGGRVCGGAAGVPAVGVGGGAQPGGGEGGEHGLDRGVDLLLAGGEDGDQVPAGVRLLGLGRGAVEAVGDAVGEGDEERGPVVPVGGAAGAVAGRSGDPHRGVGLHQQRGEEQFDAGDVVRVADDRAQAEVVVPDGAAVVG